MQNTTNWYVISQGSKLNKKLIYTCSYRIVYLQKLGTICTFFFFWMLSYFQLGWSHVTTELTFMWLSVHIFHALKSCVYNILVHLSLSKDILYFPIYFCCLFILSPLYSCLFIFEVAKSRLFLSVYSGPRSALAKSSLSKPVNTHAVHLYWSFPVYFFSVYFGHSVYS